MIARTPTLGHPYLNVRRLGGLMFGLVLSEGALGVASVGESPSGGPPLLIGHVALGAIVVGIAVWLLIAALRFGRGPGALAAMFTSAAALSTAATGAFFLITGTTNGLNVDRALALAALGGAVLMMVWGSGPLTADEHRRPPRPIGERLPR